MNTYIELWCNVVRAVVVVVGSVDGGDDVTRVDDVIAHHVIARGGFARHSVDARRRASPPVTALDDTGTGSADRFRRGGPARSTLPPRCVNDQTASSPAAPRRVVFTDVDVVVLPAASTQSSSGGVRTGADGRRAAKMNDREQRGTVDQPPSAVSRSAATAMFSRIAPPSRSSASSKSKISSSSQSAALGACSSEQEKKGERLSNYNKGSMPPPTRLRPPKSPPPTPVMTTAACSAWTSGGVSSPQLNRDQSAKQSVCGPLAVGSTPAEDPGQLPRMKSDKSPKHRSKQLAAHMMPAPRHIDSTDTAGFSSFCVNVPGPPNSLPPSWSPKLSTLSDNDTRNYLLQFYQL